MQESCNRIHCPARTIHLRSRSSAFLTCSIALSRSLTRRDKQEPSRFRECTRMHTAYDRRAQLYSTRQAKENAPRERPPPPGTASYSWSHSRGRCAFLEHTLLSNRSPVLQGLSAHSVGQFIISAETFKLFWFCRFLSSLEELLRTPTRLLIGRAPVRHYLIPPTLSDSLRREREGVETAKLSVRFGESIVIFGEKISARKRNAQKKIAKSYRFKV